MHRVALPSRSLWNPALYKKDFLSELGYWNEGFGYEISQSQAEHIRKAASKLSQLVEEALVYVFSNDDVLSQFIFTPSEKTNAKILQLLKDSWQNDRSKARILERWDMAYDGTHDPKLLEINSSFFGLTSGTGPIQEGYIKWLKKQPGYEDAQTFGNLGPAIVASFKNRINEVCIRKTTPIPVLAYSFDAYDDRSVQSDAAFIRKCISAAGQSVVDITLNHLHYDFMSGHTLFIRENRINRMKFRIPRSKINVHPFPPQAFRLKTDNAYFHIDFGNYVTQIAAPEVPPKIPSANLMPFWTHLLDNKVFLAVLFQLFPDHENLLPTKAKKDAHKGKKRILKKMVGSAGSGAILLGEDDKVITHKFDENLALDLFNNRYISQIYCDGAFGSAGQTRIINLFVANGEAAGMSVREAPGVFAGGSDTQTTLVPVIVRPDAVVARLRNTMDAPLTATSNTPLPLRTASAIRHFTF